MKQRLLLLAGLLVLTACASPAAPAASEPTSAPATVAVSEPSEDVVVASAQIEPARVSNLSFTLSALVREIAVTEGEVVEAGQVLMVLDTPELDYAAVAAEDNYNARALAAQLQKAERVKYVDPNTGVVRWYAIPREVYEKALSQANQAQAAWDVTQANLAAGTLAAPFNGTVVDIAVIPGELVQVNQVVLAIADLESLQVVTTDLSERDIARVKVGQSASIYIEALDVTVTGKVVRISPISETVGGDVTFPVTLELDDVPAGLLWGMSAEVEIETK